MDNDDAMVGRELTRREAVRLIGPFQPSMPLQTDDAGGDAAGEAERRASKVRS